MGWGQEVQVGAQAVAEEAVSVVSGAAAAVSCRRAGGQNPEWSRERWSRAGRTLF